MEGSARGCTVTDEYLQEIEAKIADVLKSNLLGIGLDKSYNLVAIEMPILVEAVRNLAVANQKLRQKLAALEGSKQ